MNGRASTDEKEHCYGDLGNDQNPAEESATAAHCDSAGPFIKQVSDIPFHTWDCRGEAEGESDSDACGAREKKREYIQFNGVQSGDTRRRDADDHGKENTRDEASAQGTRQSQKQSFGKKLPEQVPACGSQGHSQCDFFFANYGAS